MADGFWKLWGAVKETSEKIYEVYKEDLQEFTSTLTNDTKEAIVQSSEVINNKIQEINKDLLETQNNEEEGGVNSSITLLSSKIVSGISNLLEQIPTHASPNSSSNSIRDNSLEDEEERIVTKDPENPKYKDWCKSYDLSAQADHIANLITANESLRSLYSSLVPTTVSYSDFWKRYFFHEKEKQETEARRAAIIQQATAILEGDDDEIKWDDDDENEEENVKIDIEGDRSNDLEAVGVKREVKCDVEEKKEEEEVKIERRKSDSPVTLPPIQQASEEVNSQIDNVIVITPQLESDTTLQNLAKLSIIEDYVGEGVEDDGEDLVNSIIDSIEDWENIPTEDVIEGEWDEWE